MINEVPVFEISTENAAWFRMDTQEIDKIIDYIEGPKSVMQIVPVELGIGTNDNCGFFHIIKEKGNLPRATIQLRVHPDIYQMFKQPKIPNVLDITIGLRENDKGTIIAYIDREA